MTRRYLSHIEVAERIGVADQTLDGYLLPAPDALIGSTPGWLLVTIDAWAQSATWVISDHDDHPTLRPATCDLWWRAGLSKGAGGALGGEAEPLPQR